MLEFNVEQSDPKHTVATVFDYSDLLVAPVYSNASYYFLFKYLTLVIFQSF